MADHSRLVPFFSDNLSMQVVPATFETAASLTSAQSAIIATSRANMTSRLQGSLRGKGRQCFLSPKQLSHVQRFSGWTTIPQSDPIVWRDLRLSLRNRLDFEYQSRSLFCTEGRVSHGFAPRMGSSGTLSKHINMAAPTTLTSSLFFSHRHRYAASVYLPSCNLPLSSLLTSNGP